MQKPAELKHNNFHSVLASENSAIYLWDLYKGSPDLSKVSNDPLIIQSSKVTSEIITIISLSPFSFQAVLFSRTVNGYQN